MKYNTKHNIPGWFGYEEFYADMAKRVPSEGFRVLEVGVMFGASAVFMVDELESLGKRGTVYLVDTFAGIHENKEAKEVSERHGNQWEAFNHYADKAKLFGRYNVTVYVTRVDSLVFSSMASALKFDFIFLDSDHSYDHVRAEIQTYLPLVKPGGIIGGHDFGVGLGVDRAVMECFGKAYHETATGHCWWVER